MSAANINWPRWIFASVSRHFANAAAAMKTKDGVTPAPIPLYIEGNERNIQHDAIEYFEFRMNGPSIRETSKNWWKVEIDINIVLNVKENNRNFHRTQFLIGQIANAFLTNLEIYRYGDGVEDDQNILTCLTLSTHEGEDIMIQMTGQLQPDLQEQQALISAFYRGIIET